MEEMKDLFIDIEAIDENANNNKFKVERAKAGINVFRFLFPYGSNHKRVFFHKYQTHWGLIGKSGKERSYACSEMVDGRCPICEKVQLARKALETAQRNQDQEKIKELDDYISKFNVRITYVYNVATLDGRIVKLELGKMAHNELIKRFKECVDSSNGKIPFDPTSLDTGCWFEIHKLGKGRYSTKYEAYIKKINVNVDGDILQKIDRSPIPVSPEVMAELRQQFEAAKKHEMCHGPMTDIHKLYDPMSYNDLNKLMNGILPESPIAAPVAPTPTPTSGVSEASRLSQLSRMAG